MNTEALQPLRQCLLTDAFGRGLTYLRLSVTDLCNLRCAYCMPKGGVAKLTSQEVLSLEEMFLVAKTAVELGVRKIRVTGGEPFLKKDLGKLLLWLSRLDPRPDLRITTNGLLLEKNLSQLLAAQVSTVNISLDSLKPARYGAITGVGAEKGKAYLARIFEAIEACLASGSIKVKINAVLQAGVNEDELSDIARLAWDRPIAVRFIEYMPVGRNKPFEKQRFLSSAEALKRLQGLGDLTPLPARESDGPARRFKPAGAQGELGLISSMSSHFCSECNRLRVSAHGHAVPCLFSDLFVDLRPALRGPNPETDVREALLQAAGMKPKRHGQAVDQPHSAGSNMSRLGG